MIDSIVGYVVSFVLGGFSAYIYLHVTGKLQL